MDTEVTVMIVHAEVIPNCITDAPTETLPNTVTPGPIVTAVTHHTGNLHHIEAHHPLWRSQQVQNTHTIQT